MPDEKPEAKGSTSEIAKAVVDKLPLDELRAPVREVARLIETVLMSVNYPFAGWRNKMVAKRLQDDKFVEQLAPKIEIIPEYRRQLPPPISATKVIEGFLLSEDAPNLREMYLNLLAASMDKEKVDVVRAGFAETIQALNPDEARILTIFSEQPAIPVIDLVELTHDSSSEKPLLLNFSLVGKEAECSSPQNTSFYLDKLCNLGLVQKHPMTSPKDQWGIRHRKSDDMFIPLIQSDEVGKVFGFDAEFLRSVQQKYLDYVKQEADLRTQHPSLKREKLLTLEEFIPWVKSDRLFGPDSFRLFKNVPPTIRQSVIMLTVFGRAFCQHCLPVMDTDTDDPRVTAQWQPNADITEWAEALSERVSEQAIKRADEKRLRELGNMY